jgi:hypothetical protein
MDLARIPVLKNSIIMRTLITSGLLLWQIATAALFSQAGYSSASVARTRTHGLMEPQQLIVEEFMNYHTHDIPLPPRGELVAMEIKGERVARVGYEDQWEEWVFQVGLATRPVAVASQRPPVNLSLVVDGSGSMGSDQKMEKVKNALQTFFQQLRPNDQVSLIRFSNEATLAYQGAARHSGLETSLRQIYPGGGTNLHAGLMLGLQQLGQMGDGWEYNRDRRLILLTDGLANQGLTDLPAILDDVGPFLEEGIQISTIGVGSDVNFDLLAELPRASGGQHHFIGSSSEDIEKVFRKEAESLLAPVLQDVSLQIQLPEELRLVQFYGYQPQIMRGEIRVNLPPLNRGLTQVMVFSCLVEAGSDFSPVVAHLKGRRMDSTPRHYRQRFYPSRYRQDPLGWSDLDLQKNYCISYMAQTLREMVLACRSADCVQAKAMADACADYVRGSYPDLNDPDILRVLNLLQQQRNYLGRLE